MKIYKDKNGHRFIDQSLYDHITKIWLDYDGDIGQDKNIYFAKNTTIPRITTDYCNKGIHRVIKKKNADCVVIRKININDYTQYFDESLNICTEDDTKEVVYGIYNMAAEDVDTIVEILDFYEHGQDIVYINQDTINNSINNGFIITNENYTTVKELVDSPHADNHDLAVKMLVQSDLKANWQWLLYIYHKKFDRIKNFDVKNTLRNYLWNLPEQVNNNHFDNFDIAIQLIDNEEVKDKFIQLKRSEFESKIGEYFKMLGTGRFKLCDFKISYEE